MRTMKRTLSALALAGMVGLLWPLAAAAGDAPGLSCFDLEQADHALRPAPNAEPELTAAQPAADCAHPRAAAGRADGAADLNAAPLPARVRYRMPVIRGPDPLPVRLNPAPDRASGAG